MPSSITNSGNLALYGPDTVGISKRDDSAVQERVLTIYKCGAASTTGGALILGGLGSLCLNAAAPLALLSGITFGLSDALEGVICTAAGILAAAIGFAVVVTNIAGWLFGSPPSQPNTGVPVTTGTRTAYGQWLLLDFGGGATSTSCDCAVTYTCRYGMGWDEICDNQRWAINKKLNGQTVFHPFSVGSGVDRAYARWGQITTQRHKAYRTLVQGQSPRERNANWTSSPCKTCASRGIKLRRLAVWSMALPTAHRAAITARGRQRNGGPARRTGGLSAVSSTLGHRPPGA